MKKIIAIILTLALVFALASCGGNGTPSDTNTTNTTNTSNTTAAPSAGSGAPAGSDKPGETSPPEQTPEPEAVIDPADITGTTVTNGVIKTLCPDGWNVIPNAIYPDNNVNLFKGEACPDDSTYIKVHFDRVSEIRISSSDGVHYDYIENHKKPTEEMFGITFEDIDALEIGDKSYEGFLTDEGGGGKTQVVLWTFNGNRRYVASMKLMNGDSLGDSDILAILLNVGNV